MALSIEFPLVVSSIPIASFSSSKGSRTIVGFYRGYRLADKGVSSLIFIFFKNNYLIHKYIKSLKNIKY